MNESIDNFYQKKINDKTNKENQTEQVSPLVEKFMSQDIRYRTHKERVQLLHEDKQIDNFFEKISKDEKLFTRYLHIFSDYDGDVTFLDENLLKIDIEPYVSLPKNYALKGGAARVSVERALGIRYDSTPRDIDICYTGEASSEDIELSRQLAKEYSPEDYAHGYGTEYLEDDYFGTRDFTINEILVSSEGAIMTKQALLDTMRSIIRFSTFEKTNFYYQDEYDDDEEVDVCFVNDKLASKALRFIAERDERVFVDDDFFQVKYINEFHMALHLDRAMEIGPDVAQAFVENLRKYNQIPDDIDSPSKCVSYLEYYTDFIYRHYDSYEKMKALLSQKELDIVEFEKQYLDTFGDIAEVDLKYSHITDFFDTFDHKKYLNR